jgi:hypothetical protein
MKLIFNLLYKSNNNVSLLRDELLSFESVEISINHCPQRLCTIANSTSRSFTGFYDYDAATALTAP